MGKSEIFLRTSGLSQIDGRTKSELLAQLNEGFAEIVISDIVVRLEGVFLRQNIPALVSHSNFFVFSLPD